MTQKRKPTTVLKSAAGRRAKPPVGRIKPVKLGRDLMEAINAVEGLHLTEEMKRDVREFDRKGLSFEERSRLLNAKYGKPG
jgi:hypothetical protein